ncbi:MAG: CBS domain-containing protein [Candidatus Hadarchaeum sp.]|uniref:CBS domain-containing protein n=1 Tax=Candidatus Hadarchaeum sp. TaxID=2883567 RepID=UPI003D0BD484
MACREVLSGVKVEDVMKPCSIFVAPNDLVTKARAVMRSTGLKSLPVIDAGRLSGIVTIKEVLQVTSTRSNIAVSGIMSPYRLVATPEMSLVNLARQMVGHEVSDVPVVKGPNDMTVVGLVRLDDVLAQISGRISPERRVGEVMVTDVVTCEPEDEISKIWDLMEKTNCSGLPVVRYDKRRRSRQVLGMITRSDIIRSGTVRLSEESDKGRFKSPPRVKSVMRTPAIVVSPQTPLPAAIDLMLEKKIGRLAVVSEGDLVGILSRSDIVRFACG